MSQQNSTHTRAELHGDAMTRRDFQRVAESLGAIGDEARRTEETARWIGVFRAANPRFDTRRFTEAVERAAALRARTRRAAEFTQAGTRRLATRTRVGW